MLFFSISALSAQNCTLKISGTIRDSSDNKVLTSSHIEIIGDNKTPVISDNKGNFSIENLCVGTIKLHVSHLDCEHIDITIQLVKDTQITIYLKHSEQKFSNFTLKSTTSKSTINTVDPKTIDKKKGSSISGLMTELGGVTLLQSGANISKPIVDGLHSNRVLIVNNGIRQEGQNWGMEHAPEIDAFLANDIVLIKGAESLKYGSDGIGGVILVQSPSIFKLNEKTLIGEFNTVGQTNNQSGIVSAYLGSKISDKLPIYWRAQGTLKNAGNFQIPNYYIANTAARELNYSAHLGLNLETYKAEIFYSDFRTAIGLYTGSQVGNLQDLNAAMQSEVPLVKSDFERALNRPNQQVKHQLLKFKNEWHLKKEQNLELTLSYQHNHREEYDVLRSSSSYSGPVFDYYINTYMGDFNWNTYNVHKTRIQVGLFGLRQSNAYTGRFFIPGFYQNGIAQYAIFKKETLKHDWEFGLRNDVKFFDIFLWKNNILNLDKRQYFGPSYTVKFLKRLNKYNSISALNSYTWRAPSTNELYSNGLHQALASIEIGDSTLKKEQSYNFSIAHVFSKKKLNVESEIFYKYINGFINLIPGTQSILTIRGAFPVFYYTQNNAALYGINYKIKWAINSKIQLKTKGNYMFGNNLSSQQFLNLMPPFTGNAALEYNFKNFSADINTDFVARQNRYVDKSDYLPPPKGFVLIGSNIQYHFKIKHQIIKTSLSITNAFNQNYRNYLNRMRYFINEPSRNITLRIIIPIYISYEKI